MNKWKLSLAASLLAALLSPLSVKADDGVIIGGGDKTPPPPPPPPEAPSVASPEWLVAFELALGLVPRV
jgi:hypothetical protein